MLLCPESEQFTPGKVFMILFGNKKYGNSAASDGKFTAAAYIVSTTFNKAILKTDIAQLQLSNIFPFTL